MSTTEEFETFALDKVCEITGAPSIDWLQRRLTSGELTAVKAGRQWRMTRADMARVVDHMRAVAERQTARSSAAAVANSPAARTRPATEPTNPAGLSKRSAARMARTRIRAA